MPRQTVAGMTLDAIRARILRGVYPEGEPLRQDSLADELGVSRIPVREALRQLEAEGLVTVTPHRGAIVTTLSAAEVEEVFALRAEVESALLRAAIPRLGPDGLALAAELLERHERALADGDAVGGGSLSWEFRAALYAAADRPVTMSIVQRLHQQSERCFVRMQLAAGAAGAAGVRRAGGEEARRALLAAVARKDGRRACALLRGELLREGRALVAFLRRA
jgi:DNA-binding GntR family transcriptional regulator